MNVNNLVPLFFFPPKRKMITFGVNNLFIELRRIEQLNQLRINSVCYNFKKENEKGEHMLAKLRRTTRSRI